MRYNLLMAYARIQVQHTGDILSIFDAEVEHVVEPILAQAIPILHGDGDRVFLAAEQAIQLKFDFNLVACFESPRARRVPIAC